MGIYGLFFLLHKNKNQIRTNLWKIPIFNSPEEGEEGKSP